MSTLFACYICSQFRQEDSVFHCILPYPSLNRQLWSLVYCLHSWPSGFATTARHAANFSNASIKTGSSLPALPLFTLMPIWCNSIDSNRLPLMEATWIDRSVTEQTLAQRNKVTSVQRIRHRSMYHMSQHEGTHWPWPPSAQGWLSHTESN